MLHCETVLMSSSRLSSVESGTVVGRAPARVEPAKPAVVAEPRRAAPVEDSPTFAPFDMDEDTWDEAIRLRYGWCPSCEEFTRRDIDPRASARACSECFDGRVCGAIHARRAGFIWVAS